jgi:ATP-dependent DNA helicase RecG
MRAALGGPVRLYPTYAGVVRATQRLVTEQHQLVKHLAEEWETTTVEFKRELPLSSEKQKAEFARDVTALANTKSSGISRYLVVGFDPGTHLFTNSFDRAIDQDRLEQILDAWSKPAPEIRLVAFPDAGGVGDIGMVEVRRDPMKLPHRMKKAAGKIEANAVFVRHGSHVVAPDTDELAELEAEGVRARA